MRRDLAAWSGCLAIGAALLWGEGIVGWANPWAAGVLIGVGVALIWLSGCASDSHPRATVLALAIAAAGLYLGQPFAYVAVLIAVALLLRNSRVLAAAWLIGLWWLLYHLLAARFHELPALAPTLAAILRALGLSAVAQGRLVHIQGDFHLPFALSWPSLGDWAILAFLLFPIATRLAGWPSGRERGVTYPRLLVLLVAYSIVRLVLQTVLIVEFPDRFQIAYHPAFQALSYLPLLPLLALWCPLSASADAPQRRFAASLLPIGVAAFGLGVALFWVPAGPAHQSGRVVIDESHSDWELTTEPLDTRWYGEYSVYNYYCLSRWLGHYYDVTTLRKGRLDTDSLSGASILLLKCPTRSYESSEVAAILSFVRRGGSIILVGDHTNVMGMSGYLNQIAVPLGVRFNFDATYDFRTGALSIYDPPSRARHPILRGLREFDFMTSCTIDPGLRGRTVIAGPGLLTEQVDYATPHFFGRQRDFLLPDGLPGLFVQAAAGDYGRGRFYLWADSTCWSNFSVFMDGLPPMLLGTMAFLGHQAPLLDARLVGLIIILLAGAFMLRDRRAVSPLALAIAIFLGLTAAAYASMAYDAAVYRHPTPVRPMTTVAFDLLHGDFVLLPASGMSRYIGLPPSKQLDLSTFYIWTQRLGLVPREGRTWADLLTADAIVLPVPGPRLSPRDAARLVEWVKSGGRLLILTDKGPAPSAFPEGALGRGRIVVDGTGRDFDATVMGGSMTVPDAKQLRIYEREFSLLRMLTAGLPDHRL